MRKLKGLLRSRRGASYIFVLAVTAFLLLLAAGALVAASASGASVADRTYKELTLMSDGVSENFLYSLQEDPDDPLGPALVKGLYDSQYPAEGAASTPRWNVDIDLAGTELPFGMSVGYMTLEFEELSVTKSPALAGREAVYADGELVAEAIPAKPASAGVDAVMRVEYLMVYNEKLVTVTDSYRLSGAVLTDTGTDEAAVMTVTEPGTWRLLTHEKKN